MLTTAQVGDFVRFMAHVHVGGTGDCWLWTGNKPDGRYGHFSVDGKTLKAHRWIYGLLCEEIPETEVVRHRCDNPACVNPRHLEHGTLSQNTRDAIERGRWPDRQGEKHPLACLSEAEVRNIRRMAAAGTTQSKIAERYEISRQQVGKIVRRENWGHVE